MNNNPNKKDAVSQNKLILAHLKLGQTITGRQALDLYDCFRLPSRIRDLKDKGYNIESKMIKTATGKRVAQYRLIDN